nr:unnamed protein product [Callosobruchus chinensis]
MKDNNRHNKVQYGSCPVPEDHVLHARAKILNVYWRAYIVLKRQRENTTSNSSRIMNRAIGNSSVAARHDAHGVASAFVLAIGIIRSRMPSPYHDKNNKSEAEPTM